MRSISLPYLVVDMDNAELTYIIYYTLTSRHMYSFTYHHNGIHFLNSINNSVDIYKTTIINKEY